MVYLRALKIHGRKNRQLMANIEFIEKESIIKPTCNHCNLLLAYDTFDYYAGYWYPTWKPVHKDCKKEAKKEEVLFCQEIDKNCNDCKFFQRRIINAPLTKEHKFLAVSFHICYTEEREWEEKGKIVIKHLPLRRSAKIGEFVTFNGFCEKKNIPVYASPNTCTAYECFEHRLNN